MIKEFEIYGDTPQLDMGTSQPLSKISETRSRDQHKLKLPPKLSQKRETNIIRYHYVRRFPAWQCTQKAKAKARISKSRYISFWLNLTIIVAIYLGINTVQPGHARTPTNVIFKAFWVCSNWIRNTELLVRTLSPLLFYLNKLHVLSQTQVLGSNKQNNQYNKKDVHFI